jgi:hypothetical protein
VFWHSYIESFQNVNGALIILFLHRRRLPPKKKFFCTGVLQKNFLPKRFHTKEKAAKHCHRCSRGRGQKEILFKKHELPRGFGKNMSYTLNF